MNDYNFWRDLFDTYQSLSDWMKFAWLIVPPLFVLGLMALVMRYRIAAKRSEMPTGNLAYTIVSDEDGALRIYSHGEASILPAGKPVSGLLPLPGTQPRIPSKQPPSDV